MAHWSEPIDRAFAALAVAFDAAGPGDPVSLGAVLRALSNLQRALTDSEIPADHHAAVRARLDASIARLAELTRNVGEERDGVGRELAARGPVNRSPAGGPGRSGGLLDVSS